MRASGWTDERRALQREAIRRWRPWARSTGPRTVAGKARVAKNAVRHGLRVARVRAFERLMADQQRFLHLVRLTRVTQGEGGRSKKFRANELLAAPVRQPPIFQMIAICQRISDRILLSFPLKEP